MDKRPELTREQLRLIYDNTSDLVFLIAVEPGGGYRVENVNRAYLQRTRLESDDLVGRRVEDVLRADQREYVKARYDAAVADGGPYSYETRTTLRGQTIYLHTTLVPVFGEGGQCTHLIGVSRDLTENKRERQGLQREKRRAENYLEIAEALIVALDRSANITMLNRKGYRMLGYPLGSLTGRSWCELCIDPGKADTFRAEFERFLENGEAKRNVNYVRTRSGEQRLIDWSNALILDDDGAITGVLASGEDITDRKRAEQALIASQRVLAADEVVAAVAHDFNNSLQGILGNIEMALLMSEEPERCKTYLDTAGKLADDAAGRLRTLRGHQMAASAAELEQLDLHELIDDVVGQTRPLWKDEAQRHGRDIRVEQRRPATAKPVQGNRSELRTVLYNVLKNAIEALPEGGVIVVATQFGAGDAVITVTDDGVGMDVETSTRVFQPFFTTKGLQAGRGLGMSASHGIVQAHGGEISVKDTCPGRGTTIEIRLPVSATGPTAPGQAPSATGAGVHRILWVDDDPEIRTLASSYLRALEHQGDVAEGGEQALSLLARNRYSAVITDVGMPGMTGLELARHIQQLDEPRPPVIALTGWGDSINVDHHPPKGIYRVVAKPVRLRKLRQILDELPGVPTDDASP